MKSNVTNYLSHNKTTTNISLPDLGKPVVNLDKEQYNQITYCDTTISHLIRHCWSQNPEDRPSFYEICTILGRKIQVMNTTQNIVVNQK